MRTIRQTSTVEHNRVIREMENFFENDEPDDVKVINYFVEFINDAHVIVNHNNSANENIENALLNMSAYYTSLKYTGYMDGHHFVIAEVKNLNTSDILSEDEVDDMYYHAFGPECISIRLNENDEEFIKYMEGFYR